MEAQLEQDIDRVRSCGSVQEELHLIVFTDEGQIEATVLAEDTVSDTIQLLFPECIILDDTEVTVGGVDLILDDTWASTAVDSGARVICKLSDDYWDSFDTARMQQGMVVSNMWNGRSQAVTKTGGDDISSIFGLERVTSGKYRWDVLVVNSYPSYHDKNTSAANVMIGVAAPDVPLDFYIGCVRGEYSQSEISSMASPRLPARQRGIRRQLHSSNFCCAMVKNEGNNDQWPTTKFENSDVITVEVDMDSKMVHFFMNGDLIPDTETVLDADEVSLFVNLDYDRDCVAILPGRRSADEEIMRNKLAIG